MFAKSSAVTECVHAKKIKPPKFKKMIFSKYGIPRQSSDHCVVIQCKTCTDNIMNTSDCADVSLDTHIDSMWTCLHCGEIFCQTNAKENYMHALAHYRNSRKKCHIFINCYDSHIFCMSCRYYLYPREIAMSNKNEKNMTKVAEHWLQVLGLARFWWRDDLPGEAEPGKRGFKNYGNTCFFVSTVQSFMHNRKLLDHLSDIAVEEEKKNQDNSSRIQKQLFLLGQEYWAVNGDSDSGSDSDYDGKYPAINPKPFWKAVQADALFGQYYMKNMEDANTLLLDILVGINPELVNKLFNVHFESTLICSRCHDLVKLTMKAISEAFQEKFSEKICHIIREYTIGFKSQSKNSETVIALAIANQSSDREEKTDQSSDKEAATIFERMSISSSKGWRPITLEDALNDYFAEEPVADYRCTYCSLSGHAIKRLKMTHAPPILTLNIKRFSPVELTTDTGKITVQIKCHRKVIVPWTLKFQTNGDGFTIYKGSDNTQSGLVTYQIFATIVHDGGMGGGHYMAYVRQRDVSGLKNPAEWLWFSDKYFGSVSNEVVAASETYIAFYERSN